MSGEPIEWVKLAVFLSCALFSLASLSEENTSEKPMQPQSIWLNGGFLTYHTDHQYRGLNYGVGFEFGLSSSRTIAFTDFINSHNRRSQTFNLRWQTIKLGDATKFGVALGGMRGYPDIDSGKWFLFVLPVLTWESKSVGLNFALIPTAGKQQYIALTTQINFRVW